MEKTIDGIKRVGTELPFNLQVENLSVQFGDCHSTTYYNDGGQECRCGHDCDRPEPLPSWDEYSDFFSADDDGFMIDMDKMAQKINKDTGVDLEVVKTVLFAESEIMDDLGIMDMIQTGEDDEDDEDDAEDEASGKEEHSLFDGLTHEQECEAVENLLKAIFPELKDKQFSFAVGKFSKGSDADDKKEGADGK